MDSIFRTEQEPWRLRDEHKLVAEEFNNYQKIHEINPTIIEPKRFKILKGDWPNHMIIGYINSGQMKYCPETKSFNVWPVFDPNNIDERRAKNWSRVYYRACQKV